METQKCDRCEKDVPQDEIKMGFEWSDFCSDCHEELNNQNPKKRLK